jgi:hypothetical protein
MTAFKSLSLTRCTPTSGSNQVKTGAHLRGRRKWLMTSGGQGQRRKVKREVKRSSTSTNADKQVDRSRSKGKLQAFSVLFQVSECSPCRRSVPAFLLVRPASPRRLIKCMRGREKSRPLHQGGEHRKAINWTLIEAVSIRSWPLHFASSAHSVPIDT